MADTVTLENLTRRPKVVVLDHPAFRDKKWGFKRIAQPTAHRLKNGKVERSSLRRSIVGSVRLPPRGKVSGLHPAIVNCSQVKTWLGASPAEVRIVPDAVAAPEQQQKKKRGSKPPKEGDSA